MSDYVSWRPTAAVPRLPLEGSIDLTYRCNSACVHCWSWLPPNSPERERELTLDQIGVIAGEARAMGCRRWSISGGEPMLRPDFPEIFDRLTARSAGYSLNSNGTLITPAIARLLTRKGTKMIALYGATADVYDEVARTPGAFEAAMRGFAYLREAGAGFVVQLIPMRANWHQWDRMAELARTLSPQTRVGAPWLYLSSSASARRNGEIARQRLAPADVIALDPPPPPDDGGREMVPAGRPSCETSCGAIAAADDRLFHRCLAGRREFHIDAYGLMSWCSFIKDPALRYDLRRGTVREAWEDFIPWAADSVRGGDEWRENCGACEHKPSCRWCAVYGYLETGRYSAPVPYLCEVAEEAERFAEDWQARHRRSFQVAGLTVTVESDLAFTDVTLKKELEAFAVSGAGDDNVTLRHHFELPDLAGKDLGVELYRKAPWVISRDPRTGTWCYRCVPGDGREFNLVAVFDDDHRRGVIYSSPETEAIVRAGGWDSLSLLPTDQIWLARVLAGRRAALVHSAAAILNGQGLLFVGHSEAGKSTTVRMLKGQAEILCDDRNVVRRWDDLWRVHGTWSHGDVADVSPASAPLAAILFLQQDARNEVVPLTDRKAIWTRLAATLIRPMVDAGWWRREFDVLDRLVDEVPCYTMRFDRSGAIVPALLDLTSGGGPGGGTGHPRAAGRPSGGM